MGREGNAHAQEERRKNSSRDRKNLASLSLLLWHLIQILETRENENTLSNLPNLSIFCNLNK